jgi:ankyrin repeat protein
VNAANRYGSTPLHIACLKGHIAATLLLLERGAAREARDANGRTPLFEAVSGRQDELVEAMVRPEINEIGESFSFEANAGANDGTTLLNAAVDHGTFDTVCAVHCRRRSACPRGSDTTLSTANARR